VLLALVCVREAVEAKRHGRGQWGGARKTGCSKNNGPDVVGSSLDLDFDAGHGGMMRRRGGWGEWRGGRVGGPYRKSGGTRRGGGTQKKYCGGGLKKRSNGASFCVLQQQ